MDKTNVVITGVSAGVGHALAQEFLARGAQVSGFSRRTPVDLVEHEAFNFSSLDLADHGRIAPVVRELLRDVPVVDLLILNAGILGSFGDLSEADLDGLLQVMDVNVWANKCVLDSVFSEARTIRQVVAMSSGASVNGNRGWRGYAISKAALNMLIKLYAHEQPVTHFCALAPGVIDTAMQDVLCALPSDERYPSLEVLRTKRATCEMPSAAEFAPRLIGVIERLPELVESGAFTDIRNLPEREATPG